MGSTRLRLAFACLAILAAAIGAGGGSAGNRTADVTFDAFPGPGSVTYEENIAYTLTFENTGGSNFTHVEGRQRVPVATFEGTEYPATLIASTCGAVIQGNEAICSFGNLPPGSPPVEATLVWRAPTIPSATGCDGCLVSGSRWFIKEGKETNANEVFPSEDVAASLLGGEGTDEKLNAGSYEITACSDPLGAGSLRTNRVVSLADPVSSTFCIPSVIPTATDLGHTTTITELPGNARHSEVCIAALGQDCTPGYLEADFSPEVVTFVFRVADAALPKGYKITQVFHNGVLLTATTCAVNQECVLSIKLDNKTKVWTIVATSPTNGLWDW